MVVRMERDVEFCAEILRPSWSDDLRMTTHSSPRREEEQVKKNMPACLPDPQAGPPLHRLRERVA
jgi:hypothetical protein